MSLEQSLERSAEFYGVTMDEARRRYEKITAAGNDPNHPICIGCAKDGEELEPLYGFHRDEGEEDMPIEKVVAREEGTFNWKNGHFLCDECYIKNGMPSSSRGWVCP